MFAILRKKVYFHKYKIYLLFVVTKLLCMFIYNFCDKLIKFNQIKWIPIYIAIQI